MISNRNQFLMILSLIVIFSILLGGCAFGNNSKENVPNSGINLASFFIENQILPEGWFIGEIGPGVYGYRGNDSAGPNISQPTTHPPNLISSDTVSTDKKPFGMRLLIMQMKPLNISFMSLPRLGLTKAKLQMKAGFFASISLRDTQLPVDSSLSKHRHHCGRMGKARIHDHHRSRKYCHID